MITELEQILVITGEEYKLNKVFDYATIRNIEAVLSIVVIMFILIRLLTRPESNG